MSRFDRPVAPDPCSLLPVVPAFSLTSTDITDGAELPLAQVHIGPGGGNLSPQLSWSGAPEQTGSYVVTCFDPDAPTGCGWWHWIVAGIPASVASLETGGKLPEGAFHVRNDFGDAEYGGAGARDGDPGALVCLCRARARHSRA